MALSLAVAPLLVVVRMTVNFLSSNRFTSSRGRNHFPALTSMQRKHSANVLTNNIQAPSKYLKIVIIKPIGDSSKTIFNNPVEFTQALLESPFNSGEINEICTNKQSCAIVAELCRPNQKLIEELLCQSNRGMDCKVSGPFKGTVPAGN